MAKTEDPAATATVTASFDGIAESAADVSNGTTPRLWGSARLSYTICAFLAMVIQLCLRNTLNFVILCMVKHQEVPRDNSTMGKEYALTDAHCGPIDNSDNSVQRVSFICDQVQKIW